MSTPISHFLIEKQNDKIIYSIIKLKKSMLDIIIRIVCNLRTIECPFKLIIFKNLPPWLQFSILRGKDSEREKERKRER